MSNKQIKAEKKWRKLYELRKSNNLTQKQVAELLGINSSNISFWEIHSIRWAEWIKQLCKAFNCTPNELLDYEEPNVEKHSAEEDPIDPDTLKLAKLLNESDLSTIVDALGELEATFRERIGKGYIDPNLVNKINHVYDLRMTFKKCVEDDRLVRA